MNSSYAPDLSTALSLTLYTALLSQRDVASRIPINYVTAPGVDLTPVCFSDRRYEDAAAQQCLSNLLALGFHRLIVDLYWDQSRQTWSLCPVELSSQGNSTTPINTGGFPSSLSTSSSSTSPSATLTEARVAGDTVEPSKRHILRSSLISANDDVHQWGEIHARQTSEFSSESAAAASITNAALTAATLASDASSLSLTSGGSSAAMSQTSSTAQPSQTGLQIGSYSCTESIGISTLTDVLADYFEATENNLNATFKYLEFNVRLAAPFDDPTDTSSPADPQRLPTFGNYISDLINSSLSSYIYTPAALRSERANLNSSWFAHDIQNPPIVEYMTTIPLGNGSALYTPDGWPSESIIMFLHALRIIAGIGSVDSQMQQYDFNADAETMFLPGYISNNIGTTISSNGTVTSGCFYQPGNTTLSASNSSWAISSNLPNMTSLNTTADAALNLSSCGISPILNKPLLGSLAIGNSTTYYTYVRDSLWGWGEDQPGDSLTTGTTGRHCAITNLSNDGLWEVADCTDENHFICRRNNSPYEFSVSDDKALYYQGDEACDQNSSFAVPRTALENRYMIAAARDWLSRQTDLDGPPVAWLSINDIDTKNCWVSGVDAVCPYRHEDRDGSKPKVVIPTVAGVIVLLLAILTILVKCAANRRNTRRRLKRGEGGWDYEGVPS
ncbi:hypothetical protein KCU81_g5598, partial [Aureobasidium melanogenum]|uniref:Maintenance of telomere capping protein 6 n=1 Tax=Aureobasidium melanogenum (strain CBS 110374) TaxID=1043003 RepID=A0A074VSM2_AURM1